MTTVLLAVKNALKVRATVNLDVPTPAYLVIGESTVTDIVKILEEGPIRVSRVRKQKVNVSSARQGLCGHIRHLIRVVLTVLSIMSLMIVLIPGTTIQAIYLVLVLLVAMDIIVRFSVLSDVEPQMKSTWVITVKGTVTNIQGRVLTGVWMDIMARNAVMNVKVATTLSITEPYVTALVESVSDARRVCGVSVVISHVLHVNIV